MQSLGGNNFSGSIILTSAGLTQGFSVGNAMTGTIGTNNGNISGAIVVGKSFSGSILTTSGDIQSNISIPGDMLVGSIEALNGNITGNISILGATGSPGSPGTFPTGTTSGTLPFAVSAVAAGNLGTSGLPDVASVVKGTNVLSTYLGSSGTVVGGYVGPRADYSSGSPVASESLALGDFNRDGSQDVAVVNTTANDVLIYTGNPIGNLVYAGSFGTGVGTAPVYVAVGDMNNDGRLDLVTANSAGNSVSVLLGNGNGTFQKAITMGVGAGTRPMGLALGDFNSDGKLDIATADYGSNNVTILLGNGNGTFKSPTQVALATGQSVQPWAIRRPMSTKTAYWISLRQTPGRTTSACCWATRTARSAYPPVTVRASGLPRRGT